MAMTDGLAMATAAAALTVRVSAMVAFSKGAVRGDQHGVTARTMTATVLTADSRPEQVLIPCVGARRSLKIQRYA